MNKVVIIVPVYTDHINDAEKISLLQLNKVLGLYDIVFVCPNNLNFYYGDYCEQWRRVYFDRKYFVNTISYSELLLSKDFYEKFSDYEYMLIYQLDAFVFQDKLEDFCNLGYDYIGSAWPMNHRYTIGREKAKIGNGGVSLRRIATTIELLKKKEYIFGKYNLEKMFMKVEDYFFSFCGSKEELNYRVPDVALARTFCEDLPTDLPMALKVLSQGKIPFCLHGWNKRGCIDYVLGYINGFGYNLPRENVLYDYRKMVKTYLSVYLINRLIRYDNIRLRNHIYTMFERPVIIWGGGTFGISCNKLLSYSGVKIECCFDKKPNESDMVCSTPNKELINSHQYIIVITPFSYEDNIAGELQKVGLRENVDYIKYSRLAESLFQKYIGECMK